MMHGGGRRNVAAMIGSFAIAFTMGAPAGAVDFNIDIQSSVGASASNASGGGPSRRVDCGSGTCAITTADDGILEYDIAAWAEFVKTGTSFKITAHGESELLPSQGNPYVTGTGDFIATIRIYSQTATAEQFVVRTVGDFTVGWKGLIPTSAGKAKAWFGTPCPGWGLIVESNALTPSGTVGPTIKSVRCVRSAAPPWNQIFEITVDMKAAAGNKVVGEKTSFIGTLDFEIQPKGKEMLKESPKDTDPVPEGLVNHPLASPIKVKVIENDSEGAADGVPIQFTVIDPDGNVVGNVLTAETQQDGIASVSGVMLGDVAGTYTIEAYCASCVAGQRISFTARGLTEEETTVLRQHASDKAGYVGERMRNYFVVQAVNRLTGQFLDGLSVDFSILTDPPCPAVTTPNPEGTKTSGGHGLARTRIALGSSPGNCRARAHCAQCLGGQDVYVDFEIQQRPEILLDGGAPGNPFSRSGGGPGKTGAKKANNFLGIEYKMGASELFHTTKPPQDGFIGALTDDVVDYRAIEFRAGAYVWQGSQGTGSGSGRTISSLYTQVADDMMNPATETVTRLEDGALDTVKVLIHERPSGILPEWVRRILVGKDLCLQRYEVLSCVRLGMAHSTAYSWAERTFEPRGRSTEEGGSCDHNCCDAGKHMYWHAMATFVTQDESVSRALGDAHERTALYSLPPYNAHNGIVMDLHSNARGRKIAKDALDAGKLWEDLGQLVKDDITGGNALVFYNMGDQLSLLVKSKECGE